MDLYNLDIERGILNSILFDGKVYEDIISILISKDFYLPFHQYVFEAMEELYKKDYPIDEFFLKDVLIKKNRFDESLFLEILATAPIEAVESYAKEIKDLSLKRKLLRLSSEIKRIVLKEDKRAIEEIEEIQSKLFDIATSNFISDFKSSQTIILNTLDYIKKQTIKTNPLVVGLDTGFIELNRMTSVLEKAI